MVGILQAMAVITILLSLVTAIDIQHRTIELFCHFRLQYFAAAFLLALIFALLKIWPYTAALSVIAIVNAGFLLPWYVGERSNNVGDTATSEPLRLFHANVYSGNNRHARFIDAVNEEDPDVIFVQEITPAWTAALQVLQQDYPHAYTVPRAGNFGIAVYSRIPFASVTHVDSPPLGFPTIIAGIEHGGKNVTLISSHPTIPLGRELFNARNEQLDSLADLAARQQGNVVLLGDFNMSLWGGRYRKLVESSGLRNARKGFGLLPTWPTNLPIAMIPSDHVLVSDGIAVRDIKTGRRFGSDHLPLVVTLSL